MKTLGRWAPLWSLVAMVPAATAATVPLFENNAPLVAPPAVAPQIDATAWVNRSVFDITSTTGLPYETSNTRNFTNTASGRMFFNPGVRFFYNTNGQRLWMSSWVNEGSIAADQFSFFGNAFFVDSRASIVQVLATNIVSKGSLSAGSAGLVRLEGRNISVPRIGIRTGEAPDTSAAGFRTTFLGSSNYVNDLGITDVYWGGGTNNSTRGGQPPMQLNSPFGNPSFDLPFPASAVHDIVYRGFSTYFTNRAVVPGVVSTFNDIIGSSFLTNGFAAAVNTSFVSATSTVVQVVFYPTNSDPSSTIEVRFSPGFGPSTAIVGFQSADFDIATQTATTNVIYLVDGLAESTNVFFARNTAGLTRRPSTMEVLRTTPFEYLFSSPPNSTYTNGLLNGPQYLRTSVTNLYAAYGARIDPLSTGASGSIPYDATNAPGRVDIIGDTVNLDQTRIRSENSVVIRANNLVSNKLAAVNAPLLTYQIGTTQPSIVISNLAPPSVKRFGGTLQAWSVRWDNQEIVTSGTGVTTTNNVLFHVLIVDSQLTAERPVIVSDFGLRGTNIVISDTLNIGKGIRLEGVGLHMQGGLFPPFGYSLGATNMIGFQHFTNDGVIAVAGTESFGADRTAPYLNYINHGTNLAYSQFIRSLNLENSGTLGSVGGPMTLDALALSVSGLSYASTSEVVTNVFFDTFAGFITNVTTNVTVTSSPATLDSISDLRIHARDVVYSNAWFNAGTLILSATNSLIDSGAAALSYWNVTNGFQALRNPTTSSLLGTYVRSTIPRFAQADHAWAATDLGAVPAGFTNNLALGKLTCDGGVQSLFSFTASSGTKALYVDYLELANTATNYNTAFSIDPSLTIYFANANVSVEKLNNALGGRFKWVPDFAGPLSSTNIYYATTDKTYTFNSALVRSKDLDSDGDGISNANDPEPIYVAENARIAVELAASPSLHAILRWRALAYSTNTVEYKSTAGNGEWSVLSEFVHGPFTSPVAITDPVTAQGGSRVYRLKVSPMRRP